MTEIKKILVPIDFSEHSLQALEYAKLFAEKFNSELILLNVIEPVVFIPDLTMGQINIPSIENELMQKSEEKINQLVNDLKNKYNVRGTVKLGKPYVEIIELSKEEKVDLIIIGSHGHTSVEHLLFGSTAEKVIKKSTCPVLVIRPQLKK
ncbi:MAG: universal stress protein [Candidatus Kryptonium sp.]|nr:universal stress protein [Candidatus Kryptonium sp.]MCX7762400.1 universal stress protein [Candidatus Kryptonium sp.]MDW8109811.1 universal stress protein [Candidatus Kryptonium sp.]